MDIGAPKPADRPVEGVVEMMLDATRHYDQPLTAERLFGWHAALFPAARSGMTKIKTGAWRDDNKGPMQIVSGALGKERVYFVAPKADRVDAEMAAFLKWFEVGSQIDAVLKAAVAHLWFVTLHPFDDGNGRIARAIADMALARSEQSPRRFYSMSAQIRQERNDCYGILEQTQKGTMDITPWMEWFLECLGRAIDGAQETLSAVLNKARFGERIKDVPINDRQRLAGHHPSRHSRTGGPRRSDAKSRWGAQHELFSCPVERSQRFQPEHIPDARLRSGVFSEAPANGRSRRRSSKSSERHDAPLLRCVRHREPRAAHDSGQSPQRAEPPLCRWETLRRRRPK
jgi:prophage maintenance system killer protein